LLEFFKMMGPSTPRQSAPLEGSKQDKVGFAAIVISQACELFVASRAWDSLSWRTRERFVDIFSCETIETTETTPVMATPVITTPTIVSIKLRP
jgi:hypothetical protein